MIARAAGVACLLAVLLLSTGRVLADAPEVTDLQVDEPKTLTVGDHVRYTVVIEADVGTSLSLAPSALPAELELLDKPQLSNSPAANGRTQITLSFTVAPFMVGDIRVPPLPIRYTAPDGTSGVIQTQGSLISVSSVLQPGDLQPRDLKPQAEIGAAASNWYLPVAGGLTLAVLALVGLALLRRRAVQRRLQYLPRVPPVALGPEDRARAELDKAGAAFRKDKDYEVYYTALGNVVRSYVAQRYDFPAFALTTRELEAAMLQRGLDRWQVRVAGGLLAQCDAVVYAGYRPAEERADADLTAAFEIVEMSRPEERQPAEAAVS